MTLYKTSTHRDDIEPVEVLRVTDKSVFLQGRRGERRESIETQYYTYHQTKDAAIACKREMLQRNIASIRIQLQKAEDRIAKFETAQGGAA